MSLQTDVKPLKHEQNHDDTAEVMRRFNEVFLRHDPTALPDLVAADCVIENTTPAPNGARCVGRDECVAQWTQVATATGTHFELEEVVTMGDRAIIRWRFFADESGSPSMRGVNLMRVRDGLIVEAMGYVKGA
jgi:ketosteroid isomerase-like protein